MKITPKTKIKILGADFSLDRTGGWWGRMIHNDNDWKFQKYKGTNLYYDMLSESVNTDQEEKEGDVLKGNRIINLKNLRTNTEKILLCKECAKERDLQIKSEEGEEQENFIAYIEAYFQLTPSDEQKGIRELYQDFKKQTYNRQTTSR